MTNPDVRIDSDAGKELDEYIEKLVNAYRPGLLKHMMDVAHFAAGEIAEYAVDLMPGGTGTLAKSFQPPWLIESGGVITAGATSNLPYAEIQNIGGKIEARTVKNLAIPLKPQAKKQWPRDLPKNTLRLMPIDGKLFLGKPPKNSKGKPDLWYILKKSITIPGTGYLVQAEKSVNNRIGAQFGKRFVDELTLEASK